MTALTEWPDESAPIADWCRPLSASLDSRRVLAAIGDVSRVKMSNGGGAGHIARRMKARARAQNRGHPHNKTPPEREAKVREMALAGHSSTEISERLGMARGSVSKIAKRLGIQAEWQAARAAR